MAVDSPKVPLGNKTCRHCDAEKPRADFRGRSARCRSCEAAISRERRVSDPEFRARRDAAIARWQAKNGDKLRAANRRYARRMPREQRAYWNHYNRLRRAGCEPDPAARSFIPVLMLDPCAYCGRRAESVDHIDPIVHGGDGSTDNLTAACLSCNKRKKDRPLLTYLLAVAGG